MSWDEPKVDIARDLADVRLTMEQNCGIDDPVRLVLSVNPVRLLQLVKVFEQSGVVTPWWPDHDDETKILKLISWLNQDI